MDEKLKATLVQRLDDLPDETARQLLDYIEFLESKYNRSTRERSPLERLADNVEGTLRASRLGGAAIKGTAQVIDAASNVVKGVADAGRVVVEELQRLDVSGEGEEGEAKAKSGTAVDQGKESDAAASEAHAEASAADTATVNSTETGDDAVSEAAAEASAADIGESETKQADR
jgi:hypothetical protein